MEGGEAEKLTDGKEGVTGFSWSPDGRRIAFLSVDSLPKNSEAARKRRDDPQVYEGDFRLSHVWVIDVGSKKATELVHTTRFTVRGSPDWSPDGKRIAYLTTPTTLLRDERRTAFIVDAATGAAEPIVASADVQGTPQWSPDGRTLAFTTLKQTHPMVPDSMPFREILNSHLVLYDVSAKRERDMSPGFDNSPGALKWSADGRTITFTAGDRVYSSVFRFDVASGKYAQLTQRQLIGGLSFDKSGARAAMTIATSTAPAAVYSSDASFASPRKLTDHNPQLTAIALGESEVVSWKSSDGQEVEGVLLKPVGYRQGSATRCSSTFTAVPPERTMPASRPIGDRPDSSGPAKDGRCCTRTRAAPRVMGRSSCAATSPIGAAATTATSWPAWMRWSRAASPTATSSR